MAKSAFNRILDADNAFRVPGSVAITANGVTLSPEISLDKLDKSRGDQKNNLGGPAYEVVVIVEAVDINPVATISLSGALAVGAEFIVDDGTNAADTLTSNADFTAGVSAIADAISLAAAINSSTATGLVANDDGAGVVYIENTLTTTGVITETVDVGDIATVVDFGVAVDESYTIDVEVGPAGFASSTVVRSLSIAAASVGHQIVAIDADTLAKQDSDHVAVRTKLTVVDGGVNTASISYAAWIL